MPTATVPSAGLEAFETLGDRTYRQISELLISGQLQPGDKLSLRSVGDRLGVSMQPVRAAVARLVADQALEVAPNRAIRVPVMTVDRFRELTDIRLAIEGFAAETAAVRRSDRDLVLVRRCDAAFRRQCLARHPDLDAAVSANRDLHFAVYRAAAMPSLLPIIEGLWLRIGPVLNLDMRADVRRLRENRAEACHAALARALDAKDPAAARAALESDIRGAATFILARGLLADGIPTNVAPRARATATID